MPEEATMEITTERTGSDDGIAVVSLHGELDASNFQDLIGAAREIYESGTRRLVIDLSDLGYMASSGIVALYSVAVIMRGDTPPDPEAGWGALHEVGADTGAQEVRVKLAAPQPVVERVIERTGLARFFEIHPDRAAAVTSFAAEPV
jgi:anti-anti-sigma factor